MLGRGVAFPPKSYPTGNRMRSFSTALFSLGAILLCGPQPALAQPVAVPTRPVIAPARPATAPGPRAASCHAGMSFDRFLTELKAQAVAGGVSQRAMAEAGPYLVYDQGIVN